MGGQTMERFDPFDGALGFSPVVRAGSTTYFAGNHEEVYAVFQRSAAS